MTKFFIFLIYFFMSLVAYGAEKQNLNCDIGPVTKNFGNSSWLVYSCDDNKSLVFVSASGSPAMPFYFFLQEGKLSGEGTGKKEFTDAAYKEISLLTSGKITEIIAETKNIKK